MHPAHTRDKDAMCGRYRSETTAFSNTRLAAFLQLTMHDFGIFGFLRMLSV